MLDRERRFAKLSKEQGRGSSGFQQKMISGRFF